MTMEVTSWAALCTSMAVGLVTDASRTLTVTTLDSVASMTIAEMEARRLIMVLPAGTLMLITVMTPMLVNSIMTTSSARSLRLGPALAETI